MPPKQTGAGRRGLRMGKYQLSSPAKTWHQGAIYRAVDDAGREVAVKLLPRDLAANAASLNRLRQEAAQASRFRHANVLRIFELGEANGSWFLALELVEASFVFEHVLDKGPLPAAKAERWLVQMARALRHVHAKALGQEKMVPPDASPGGFLVTKANEIKLVPLAILLKGENEDFSPAEFVSPEHKRNPQARDIRNSIFSLGGTLHYMLTGQAPSSSSLKDMEAEVPDRLLGILERMLSAQPDDRYQSPAELLTDLDALDEEAEEEAAPEPESEDKINALSELAKDDGPAAEEPTEEEPPEPADESPPDDLPRKKSKESGPGEKRKPLTTHHSPLTRLGQKLPMPYLVGGLAALVILVGGIIFLLTRGNGSAPRTPDISQGKPPDKKNGDLKGKTDPKVAELDVNALWQEFVGPWEKGVQPVPKDATVLRVSRAPALEGTKPGKVFPSLKAACAAAPEATTTIIEIYDNGPLFEEPIAISGRNIRIGAGPDYLPLLVWDLGKSKGHRKGARGDDAAAFISVERGDLTLGAVEIGLDWPADASSPASLVRVSNGDFYAWNCTFSTAGPSGQSVSVVQFDGTEPGKRCRLQNCFARGPNLVAIDLRAPVADVLLDNCLLCGKDLPLVRSVAPAAQEQLPTVRVLRSTLVSDKAMVQVQPAAMLELPADPKSSGLRWMSWDAILSRAALVDGGTMLELPKDADPKNFQWKAINTLYAGWQPLLSGPEQIDKLQDWQKRWGPQPGALPLYPAWKDLAPLDPSQSLPQLFTTNAPLASYGQGVIGCDLTKLHWSRWNWVAAGYTRFQVPVVNVLTDSKPPAIPVGKDGKYYGGKVDLSETDLVQHLQDIRSKQELGKVLVLHLSGSGIKKIAPLDLKNTSLALYFEPAAKGKQPLVLVPEVAEGSPEALIRIQGGSLDIIGGDIRLPDVKTAKVPHYLVSVVGGNLRLHGARLQGSLTQAPDSFWGLIRLEGSGRSEPSLCSVHESVLLSPRVGVHVAGTGARLRLRQNLIVSGSEALHFQPGARPPAVLNVQCTLENNTVAARQAAVFVNDVPAWNVLAAPIIFQTKANVFLNPFLGRDKKGPAPATMLLYQGLALPRGVVDWQGQGDVYDQRLAAFALAAAGDDLPPRNFKPQAFAVWENLWGRFGTKDSLLNVPFKGTLDLDRPQLELLAYPDAPPGLALGANLERLGIKK